jgi:hypothetical protein
MLRFTIRDLLWLMLVVAVIVLWRIENARQDAFFRRMIGSRFSLKSDLDSLAKKARPVPKLKADIEAWAELESEQLSQLTARRMALLRQYRELKEKVDALPLPEPSIFDEWPPEPLPPLEHMNEKARNAKRVSEHYR